MAAASGDVAAAASSSRNHLRASSEAAASASASSEDAIPDIAETRSLQESSEDVPDIIDARSLQDNADATNSTENEIRLAAIPVGCLNLLAASANQYQKLRKENYFVFTDGMSNGYYSFNNMTSFGELPMPNKYGFVTLSCQCHAMGGRGNCCQGDRAKLDVTGIDDPATMSEQMQAYVNDICKVTSDAIGDNVRPPSGELPTTSYPTSSVPPTSLPSHSIWPSDSPTYYPTRAPIIGTRSPTVAPSIPTATTAGSPSTSPVVNIPGVVGPGTPDGSDGRPNGANDGLSGGAWAGLAIAGACILTLMIYVMSDRHRDEYARNMDDLSDRDLDDVSRADGGKPALLAITAGDGLEMDPDRPLRQDSPDATNSLTASDVSSIQSMGTTGKGNCSAYYANNSLLPGRPDDESLMSSSDGPSFFNDDDDDVIEEGVEVTTPNLDHSAILNSSSSDNENLDRAIEDGNWEAVAASAAAMVNQSSTRSVSSV